MVHDMAVTQRHLVLPLPPVQLRFDVPADGPRQFALARQATLLNLLDAAHIEDGPVAQAQWPLRAATGLPRQFHGALNGAGALP